MIRQLYKPSTMRLLYSRLGFYSTVQMEMKLSVETKEH
jgi:hypothetical protein